jgi:hypothetical protein
VSRAIDFRNNKDGTYTLFYFDHTVGHVSRVKRAGGGDPLWRAVRHGNGEIHYARSKDAARRYLLETFA